MTTLYAQTFMRRTRRSPGYAIMLALLGALLAAAPLWGPGIVNTRGGGDSPFLLQRTMEMANSLRQGIFPVRWMAHAAYDLGYPFFNHYAALPYYISGTLVSLGVNPLSAVQITQTLGFLAAALTMLWWARTVFHSRTAAAIASLAYTFAPFHMVNVYVRGDSLSEFYAFIWYPLILWTLKRLVLHPSRSRLMNAALAYGALILTHNVSALIFSPFALLYGVVVTFTHTELRGDHTQRPLPILGYLLAAFVMGMVFTAWFWMPAIIETRYTQMGPEFTEGYFHYVNHFRSLNLVQRKWAFDYQVADTTQDAGPFAMGAIQALFALMGISVLIWQDLIKRVSTSTQQVNRRRALKSERLTLMLSLVGSTLMITPWSRPLWDTLPLLPLTQFPWRFLSVQACFSAVVTGALLENWSTPTTPRRMPFGLGAPRLALSVLLGIANISAGMIALHPERLVLQASDVNWTNLLLYETFTGNIGTTIRYEYLPRDVVPRLYISEAVIDGSGHVIPEGRGASTARLLTRTPTQQRWRVTLPQGPTTVAFPINWWPGWQALVDGAQTPTAPMPGSGRLALTLDAGTHHVTLRLRPTPLERIALVITVLPIVLYMGSALRGPWLGKRVYIPTRLLSYTSLLFTLSLLGPFLLQHAPQRDATFFDFELMPYPHQGPVIFGDALLEEAQVAQTNVEPGQSLKVTLQWRHVPKTPLTSTLRLVSPAEPRHNVPYVLSETNAQVTPTTTMTVTLPDDLSRGLYLLQLQVHDPSGARTPSTLAGHTMGALHIGAIRVQQGPTVPEEAPQVGQFKELTLHTVEFQQPSAESLRIKHVWSTTGTPRNWRLSFRLMDVNGRLLVQQDHQPGYGYLPTTLWEPGHLITDYAYLTLPEGLAPGRYTLRIITYLMATGEGGGSVDVPLSLTKPTLYDLREASCEQARHGRTILCQASNIALLHLDLPDTIQEGEDLPMVAVWNALAQPSSDLEATWILTGPDGETLARQTNPIAPGSMTSAWPPHTWVRSPVALPLPSRIPAGTYTVDLTLSDAEHHTVSCNGIAEVTIQPRPRVFAAPELPHREYGVFGGDIALLGYALEHPPRSTSLKLDLYWQALREPQRDYKRFVHLYEPDTERIVAQDDAMPRNWSYPTSWWQAGEVVSETVTLDLSNVAAGTYRLAVGWYDPDTGNRLPAHKADQTPLPFDRLVLNEPVEIP